VTWLDSDDILLPGAVQACVDTLDAHPDAVAAFTDHEKINASGAFVRHSDSHGTGPYDPKRQIWMGGYSEHITVFRRSALAPFLTEIESMDQGACRWLRARAATQGRFIHVERSGGYVRIHDRNLSHSESTNNAMLVTGRINQLFQQFGLLPRHRVDCHVLYCHEPRDWLKMAIASVLENRVNLFLCPGIAGKVGLARALAFAEGSAEYVAWVDGDDEVMPGAFEAALDVLDANPDVVSTYCDIQLIDHPEGQGYIKGPWTPKRQLFNIAEVHHLHVMRRSAVLPYLEELAKWDGYEEFVLMALLAQHGRHHHIPRRLYRFRQHAKYQRAGSIGGPKLFRQAYKTVSPILMDLYKRGIKQA
jgi:hypothetical protein